MKKILYLLTLSTCYTLLPMTLVDVGRVLSTGDTMYSETTGQTVLHEAAQKGFKELVDLFLARGIDVDTRDISGCTPLECALNYGHVDVAHSLIENGATISPRAIYWAADYEDLCMSLLKKEIPISSHKLLIYAVRGASVKLVLYALNKGNCDINKKTNLGWGQTSALHEACWRGHEEIASLLIEHGADVDISHEPETTPLSAAAAYGHGSIVCLLLKHKADPLGGFEWKLFSPLWEASIRGHNEVCRLLLLRRLLNDSFDAEKRIIIALCTFKAAGNLPVKVASHIMTYSDDDAFDVLAMESGKCSSLNALKRRLLKDQPTHLLRLLSPERISQLVGKFTADSATELWAFVTRKGCSKVSETDIPFLNTEVDEDDQNDTLVQQLEARLEDYQHYSLDERFKARSQLQQLRTERFPGRWKSFVSEEFSLIEHDE